MYTDFFGFTEKPFKLVPNPAYLYLSRSHEEAMAHLTYGLSQGEGFVIITGEVGTGKTTLCRAFLSKLDSDTEAAYIFNPKLDANQLLSAINVEFRIPSHAATTKDLIDILNIYLLEQKSEGKKVIVLIDEAQNLSQDVLEQLRLLSNLETTQNKLLQIILVGQPELGDLLNSYDLRQLRQRITLNCHLQPLTDQETEAYIHHRLQIASTKSAMRFDRAVLKAIYKYSGGIPRLINIACDRSLLSAYAQNQTRVTGRITRSAIRELSGYQVFQKNRFKPGPKLALVSLLAVLTLFLLFLWNPSILSRYTSSKASLSRAGKTASPVPTLILSPPPRTARPVPPAPQPDGLLDPSQTGKPTVPVRIEESNPTQMAAVSETKPLVRMIEDLSYLFEGTDSHTLRSQALKTAMNLWYPEADIQAALNTMSDDNTFFRLAATQNGLLSHPITCDLNLITKLNLPVILALKSSDGKVTAYVTVLSISGENITIQKGTTRFLLDKTTLAPFCSGKAYVIWKNFINIQGTIPLYAPLDSIVNLKVHLRNIGFTNIDILPAYDAATREVIKAIQSKHGLPADGIVGSLTKIVLYNEKKTLPIPHIITGAQKGKGS